MFKTTAIYPNRIADKRDLEWRFKALQEEGNASTQFFVKNLSEPLCRGYKRVVYGDGGPYIEFERENILFPLRDQFGKQLPSELPSEEKAKFYYYWCYAREVVKLEPVTLGSFTQKESTLDRPIPIKIYWQIKPVTNLPNAPKRDDGKPSKFNRTEGYADYLRGMYYIDPYLFKTIE